MNIIRTHLFDDDDADDTKKRLKEDLADNFSLFVEDDKDILEIILVHGFEFDVEDSILLGIHENGIALATIFIPYTNIAGIQLITAE